MHLSNSFQLWVKIVSMGMDYVALGVAVPIPSGTFVYRYGQQLPAT